MAAISSVVAAVGIGLAGASTIGSIKAQRKAAKAQNQANELQRQQNDLQAARQRRDAVRAARTAYAQSQQAAENQGAASTSSSMGGLSSIQSQLGDNLSFLDRFNTLSDQASQALGQAAIFSSKANEWQGWANFGLSAAGAAPTIASVFGKKSG